MRTASFGIGRMATAALAARRPQLQSVATDSAVPDDRWAGQFRLVSEDMSRTLVEAMTTWK